MEKLYIITIKWQYNSGENGMEIMAFKNYENAVKRFDQKVEEATIYFTKITSNSKTVKINVGENKHWTIFENVAYSDNNIDIRLLTKFFEDVE